MSFSVEVVFAGLMHSTSLDEYLDACCALATQAGEGILRHFGSAIAVQQKPDASPVTLADTEANRLIVDGLAALTPHVAIISEEEDARPTLATGAPFWLVDPLDGTRAFLRAEPEFTVNIALIIDAAPVLGVVYAPATGQLYCARKGGGAKRILPHGSNEMIRVRPRPAQGLRVTKSRAHPSARMEKYLASLGTHELLPLSSSIKFCLLAEGSADLYPRFGHTMEWDTAAGHAILNEAGGRVEQAEGGALAYGKAGFHNPGFIAHGGQPA